MNNYRNGPTVASAPNGVNSRLLGTNGRPLGKSTFTAPLLPLKTLTAAPPMDDLPSLIFYGLRCSAIGRTLIRQGSVSLG